MPLDILKNYCSYLGSNINLVQGAGGNVSYKENEDMWIKASGTRLVDALEKNIFVHIDADRIKSDFYSDNIKDLSVYIKSTSDLRPSIETLMHAIIEKKFVVHLHPIDILYYAILSDGEKKLNLILKDFNWRWVEYVKPGLDLAKLIASKENFNASNIFILANHGIIISGDTIEEIENLLHDVLYRCCRTMRSVDIFPNVPQLSIPGFSRTEDLDIAGLAFDEVSLKFLNKKYLYPDQVVFLGVNNPIINNVVDTYNFSFIVVPGNGTFISKKNSNNVLAMLKGHSILLKKFSLTDEIRELSISEVEELIHWESEKYRKLIA